MREAVEREVRRERERHEAVRLDPERRQVAPVGHRGHEHRDGDALGVELADHAREPVEEGHVRRCRPGVEARHLELDVVADDRADLREHVVRPEARKRAPVEVDDDLAGDDVHRRSAVDDRRVDGVSQRCLVARPRLAELLERCVGRRRIEQGEHPGALRSGKRCGHRLEHLPREVGDVDRRSLPVEGLEHPREPRHRAAAHRPRRVASRPAHGRAELAHLLLGHLDRVGADAADVEREAAHLAERVTHSRQRLWMLLSQEPRAEVAARLLVREHAEDEPSRRHGALLLRPQECRDHHRHARLHVEGAAAPDLAVDELGRERRMRPLLTSGRHDVDVAVEQERRAAVLTAQPRDEIRDARGRGRRARSRPRPPARSAWTCSTHARSLPGGFVVSYRMRSRSSSTGSGTTLTARRARPAAGRPRRGCCSGRSPRALRRRTPRAPAGAAPRARSSCPARRRCPSRPGALPTSSGGMPSRVNMNVGTRPSIVCRPYSVEPDGRPARNRSPSDRSCAWIASQPIDST